MYIAMKFGTEVNVFAGKFVYLIVLASLQLAVNCTENCFVSVTVTVFLKSNLIYLNNN